MGGVDKLGNFLGLKVESNAERGQNSMTAKPNLAGFLSAPGTVGAAAVGGPFFVVAPFLVWQHWLEVVASKACSRALRSPTRRTLTVATAIRRAISWMVLTLMVAASPTAYAYTNIVQNANGSFSISIGDQGIVISASLAASVIDALRENGNDPHGLETVVRALVADNAGGADDVALALAIAVFAISRSSGDSGIVTAIINGTTGGNSLVTPQVLLSALAASVPSAPKQMSPNTQDTVEDPSHVSPV